MAGVTTETEQGGASGERIRDVSFVGCDINEYLTNLIGPTFENYRKLWTAAEQQLQTPEFPLFLQVETVDGCNLKCKMCFRRLEKAGRVRWMDSDLFLRIIDEVRPDKCPSMCLNGNNEPLLDPLMPERIAMAHAAGILDTRINTNGMLLSEEMSTRLIESGLTRLSVSMDAARSETYAGIRSGGDFELVVRNVCEFLKIRQRAGVRLPVLRITFVELQENQDEKEEFLRFWSDKADYVSFQRYVPHTPADRALKMGADLVSNSDRNLCSQPFERLIIDVEGNVFPCCSPLGTKLILGSLQNTTLQDLWNSAREKHLRHCLNSRNSIEEPVCALCLG